MKYRSCRHSLIAAGIGLLLFGPAARADDVRPVQIVVKELRPGEYDVKWSVPKVMPARSMPSPHLPQGSKPVGERTFVDRPSAWLTRQVYHCPGGLAGRPLGIDFPLYNIGLSTLIRVEFLSGERYAHLLRPGEDSWLVPEASGGGFARRLSEARPVLAGGVRHFFGGWVHLVFLLMICLLGDARIRVRLATAFLLGQVGAVLISALSGVRLDAPLAEIGVAVATVILAREALRPADQRKQLAIVAASAGITHGLGIQSLTAFASLASLPGHAGGSGVFEQLVFVLGMDIALLTSVVVVSGLVRIIRERPVTFRLARAAVYGAASNSRQRCRREAWRSRAPGGSQPGHRTLPSRASWPSRLSRSGTRFWCG